MKKTFIIPVLLFLTMGSHAQSWWEANFDPPNFSWISEHFYIDTLVNADYTWQVGQPGKGVFTSAYSSPNVLVTDTMNPIPPNTQMVFYIKHFRESQPFHVFRLHFMYWMQGDSSDYGTIEISPDQGNTWINLLTDDETYSFYWLNEKPDLKGNTGDWQTFDVDMSDWASGFGIYPVQLLDGEVIFRFTYSSSSNEVPRDGWMIDNLTMEDWWEGIEEPNAVSKLVICPNPADQQFNLKSNGDIKDIGLKVFSLSGHLMVEMEHYSGGQVDVSNLANGMYFIEYSSGNRSTYLKLQVSH
jgi:hypothetical protein